MPYPLVQKWLGHHSPAFTLATYVHLLGDDLGEPLSLDAELPEDDASGVTLGATSEEEVAQEVESLIDEVLAA